MINNSFKKGFVVTSVLYQMSFERLSRKPGCSWLRRSNSIRSQRDFVRSVCLLFRKYYWKSNLAMLLNRSYYVIGRQWIWGPIGCAVFTFSQNLGKYKHWIYMLQLIDYIKYTRKYIFIQKSLSEPVPRGQSLTCCTKKETIIYVRTAFIWCLRVELHRILIIDLS